MFVRFMLNWLIIMKSIFKIKSNHTIDLVKSYFNNKEMFLERFANKDLYPLLKSDYNMQIFNENVEEYLVRVDELYQFQLSETGQAFNTILIAIEYAKSLI